MLLKVGELARQSGLTVRTLHHYDGIGLLKPSGRSEAGYRLYDADDIARLHGIQALRQLGLPLADIATVLDGDRAAPQVILQQQMNALDEQIRQAGELRERLSFIRDSLAEGHKPATTDWLRALALMATYGKYFSAGELRRILGGFRKIEDEWTRLMAEVRALMDRGLGPESPQVQALARRWMALVHHWMDGDFSLMNRWGEMYLREPAAHGRGGGPPTDMLHFMQRANDARMNLLKQHFTMDELAKVRYVPEEEWRAVGAEGARLLAAGEPPTGAAARAVARRYFGLLGRLVSGDGVLVKKLVAVTSREPLLQAGSALPPDVRSFLLESLEGLDPHAT